MIAQILKQPANGQTWYEDIVMLETQLVNWRWK